MQQLTGTLPDSVDITGPSTLDGGYASTRWVIKMPFSVGNNVPLLTATPDNTSLLPGTGGVTVMTSLGSYASSNITGTLSLSYGDSSCQSVAIDVNANSESDLLQIISGIPGLPARA